MKSKSLPFIVSHAAHAYIQCWGATNRLESIGREFNADRIRNGGPFIFCFWHSRQIFPLYYYKNTGVSTLVSKSRDGEFITQTIRRCGLEASRGSSSRNGSEGLLGLLHWLKKGHSVAVTPDGPRGPRETVQSGIIHLARLAGIPIMPATWAASRCLRMKSWDHFMVPLPFGVVREVIGKDVAVPIDASSDVMEEKRIELQEEMRRITRLADEILPESQRFPLDNT
ncbi:MAG: DUF374 domain-containing protein [bacterium]|nr:DUF374 domain-containing protein [bacterium]